MGDQTNNRNEVFPEVLNIKECAQYTRICESKLRQLVREKRIPYLKITEKYLFLRRSLDKWQEHNEVRPTTDNDEATEIARGIWKKATGL